MRYAQARHGRTFVIRLEDGDIVHRSIELLVRTEGVKAGYLVILGGADEGSSLVVGPAQSRGVSPVVPMDLALGQEFRKNTLIPPYFLHDSRLLSSLFL